MSGADEHRSEVQFYYHVSHYIRQRLSDIKELEAISGSICHDNMNQVNEVIRQTNAHIEFIEENCSMAKEHKDAVSLDFVKLKLALSEYQSSYNLQMLNLSLQMANSNLEETRQKYDAKSQECEELISKLQSLESKIAKSQPGMEKIDLQGPLAIAAKLDRSIQETRCFVFDNYTTYDDLCKKIQEAFSLESFTVVANERHENGFKVISTTDDYKQAIQNLLKDKKLDGHAHLMEIYVQDHAEKEVIEMDSASETESDNHSEEFVNLCKQDPLPVISGSEAKSNAEEKTETYDYRRQTGHYTLEKLTSCIVDSVGLKLLPPEDHINSWFGSYHWRIRDWQDCKRKVKSETFKAGGHEWSIVMYCPPLRGRFRDHIFLYLKHAGNLEHIVQVQYVVMISNVTKPEIHHYRKVQSLSENCQHFGFLFPVKYLDKEHEGKGPYVENDQLHVSAYFRVVEAVPEHVELHQNITSEKANE
ncbi:hypothetical protein EC973_001025 [Apophysomyces ossiformis]|uniref:MATH domain-containing protein n=1 Tax=Apophysomyces ossiformis TaxID=679940 RepID=A0A8H7BUW5_9FUNG|nr:hypothetical protein EC973_001025 [Apophysomyces ossiformis]